MFGTITFVSLTSTTPSKNTYTNFGLLPQGKLTVATPKVKTNFVDVSGTDGKLDLTTALTGDVLYDNREGDWDFAAANRYRDPQALQHELNNFFHGRRLKAILSSDPNYYYIGRFSVTVGKLDRAALRVSIHYILEPYKYEMYSSTEDWLWDPFCFETDFVREYGEIAVAGSYSLYIPGSTRPSIPVITASTTMALSYKGMTYTLSSTEGNRFPAVVIREGDNTLDFVGTGTVSVEYRGGWL